MIEFNASKELFDNDFIVSVNCQLLPDMFKQNFKCKAEYVEEFKRKRTIEAITELVKRMAKQRFENLKFANKLSENQLTAYNDINKTIDYYIISEIKLLNNVLRNILLPALKTLEPSPQSRFYKGYETKLIALKNISEKIEISYKN